MDKLYYSPKEVAAILGISDDSVIKLVNRGDLPALRVSARLTRIPVAAFDLWREGYRPRRRRVVVRPTDRVIDLNAGERLPKERVLVER